MDSDARGGQARRHVVASIADLQPGQRKIIRFAGREIGLFNVKGKFYALQNRCPHKGGPLCRGRLGPLVVATDNFHFAFQREEEILKCPWHQWEFDIQTGRAICDANLRVKCYTVVEEEGKLVIYLPSGQNDSLDLS